MDHGTVSVNLDHPRQRVLFKNHGKVSVVMRKITFYWLLLFVVWPLSSHGLNLYTASVDQPDAQYSQLLSGNDVFEAVYSTFNSTGLLLLGGAL